MRIKLGYGSRETVEYVGRLEEPSPDRRTGSMDNGMLSIVEVELPDPLAGRILRGHPSDDICSLAGLVEEYLSVEACDQLEGDFWTEINE